MLRKDMAANTTVTEIKDRLNIVDVLSSYIQLKKAGTNYKANCPFHNEKTASLIVTPGKQIWHCFGCGEGGDVFSFLMKYENIEFKEALQILADRAGVKIPQYTPENKDQNLAEERSYKANELAAKFYSEVLKRSESAKPAWEYVQKRGLKPNTLSEWLIGYAPANDSRALENILAKKGFTQKELITAGLVSLSERGSYDRFFGRLTFPIWNASGKIVGFTARVLDSTSKAAKYVNSPETPIYHKSKIIFGLFQARQAIRKQDEVIIVEGNMDVIACHQAGFKNVIGSSGTAFTSEQFTLLSRYSRNLKFAFDADQAGVIASKRALDFALEQGMNVSVVKIEGAKDPDELIQKDPKLFATAVADAPRYMDYFFDLAFKKFDRNSVTQKKQAAAELVPMIAKLTDRVEIAHYCKRLSTELDISEKTIYEEVSMESVKQKSKILGGQQSNQLKRQSNPTDAFNLADHANDRAKSLEEHLVGYALFPQNSGKYQQIAMSSASKEDFSIPAYREIFENLSRKFSENQNMISTEPIYFSDTALQDAANMALFVVESEYELDGQKIFEKDQELLLKEFKSHAAKIKLALLVSEITRADREKDKNKIAELNKRFAELSKALKESEL
jgi:DNA primase